MTLFKRSFSKLLYKGHRHIGFAISLILILLSITGVALNHTSELKLDQRFIKSPLILDWYGISPATELKSFAIKQHWITQLEQAIYFNNKAIFTSAEPLIGAIMTGDFIVAAFNHHLVLLTLEGDVIESIPKPLLKKIGNQNGIIFIQQQQHIYSSKDQLLSWQKDSQPPQKWSTESRLPKAMSQALKQSSREQILDVERLILDIHSGRFFGQYGVYFIDLSGVLLIFLSLSGIWFWLRSYIKRSHKK
jgi:hypothetical protein